MQLTINLFPYSVDVATIHTIFPHELVTTRFSNYFLVPMGHTGVILTCTGWLVPPQIVQWRKNGVPVRSTEGAGIVTRVTLKNNSLFSAALIASTEFGLSDIGNYTCVIVIGATTTETETVNVHMPRVSTVTVFVRPVLQSTSTFAPARCSKFSFGFFQLRLLDANCDDLKNAGALESDNMVREFEMALKSALNTECIRCGTSIQDDLFITHRLQCSEEKPGAALFLGAIRFNHQLRGHLFCALRNWQQRRPLISFHGTQFYRVDHNCSLKIKNLNSVGCGDVEVESSFMLLLLGGASTGGLLLAYLCVLLVFGTCCQCCRSKPKRRDK